MPYQQRLTRLRQAMQARAIEQYAIISWEGSDQPNLQYLTGFSGSFGIYLVADDRARFFTDSRYLHRVKETLPALDVHRIKDLNSFAKVLVDLNIPEVTVNGAVIPVGLFQKFEKELDERATLTVGEDLVYDLRAVKDAEEIEHIQKAQSITDKTFEHICAFVKPGMSEAQVGWEMESFMRHHGAHALAFPVMVASGPNSALPHHETGTRKIQNGDFLLFDFGAKADGYCSDMTRTVVIGNPTDKHRKIYDLVLQAQQAALAAIRAKVDGKQVDRAARDVIEAAGYGEHFGHGTGHGLGLDVHESPRLTYLQSQTLPAASVVTVEPGIYLEGWGGVRIEDLVVVTDTGINNLTQSPKDLICI